MTPVTRKVRVKVPATSANLGSGFDTVGLALDYHDELEFTLSADPVNTAAQVMIEGEGEDTLPRDETHLVVSTFRRACQTFGLGRGGFILQAPNNIPQARGWPPARVRTPTHCCSRPRRTVCISRTAPR